MRIIELNIGCFGGISDKKLRFGGGVDLIIGNNESGKSTVAAFIRYLFYGFARGEKELLSDVRSGVSHGSALFERDSGERFLISRRDARSGRSRVSVTTDSGEPFDEWERKGFKEPGEYFWGMPDSLFCRSVFISQRGGVALGRGAAEAVRNLVDTGSDELDLERAVKRLDECRAELKHKKGDGGRLYELCQQIEALDRRFSEGEELRSEAEQLQARIRGAEEELAALDLRLSAERGAKSRESRGRIRTLLAEREKHTAALGEASVTLRALRMQNTYKGFIPDKDYADALIRAEREAAEKRHAAELRRVTPDAGDGARRGSFSLSSGCFMLVLAAAFAAIGVFYNALLYGACALFGVLGVFLILKGASARVRNGRKDLQGGASAVVSLKEAEEESKRAENALGELLGRWGKSSFETADELLRAFLNSESELKAAVNSEEMALAPINAELLHYSEDEISAAVAEGDSLPLFDSADGGSAGALSAIEAERQAKYEELSALRLAYAEKYSSLPDMVAISRRRAEAEREKKRLEERFGAISLALEALSHAGAEQRRNVSPYLSQRAGELLSRFTEGRHNAVGIAGEKELSLSYLTDGEYRSADYLSAGSADLAWLCLRLAMHERLSGDEPLPLILDECFVRLDDGRLASVLGYLSERQESGVQTVLFSANNREKALMGGANIIHLG